MATTSAITTATSLNPIPLSIRTFETEEYWVTNLRVAVFVGGAEEPSPTDSCAMELEYLAFSVRRPVVVAAAILPLSSPPPLPAAPPSKRPPWTSRFFSILTNSVYQCMRPNGHCNQGCVRAIITTATAAAGSSTTTNSHDTGSLIISGSHASRSGGQSIRRWRWRQRSRPARRR